MNVKLFWLWLFGLTFIICLFGTVYAGTVTFKDFTLESDGTLSGLNYVYSKPWWTLKFKVSGASYVKIVLPPEYGKPLNVICEDTMLAAPWSYNAEQNTITVYCTSGLYGVYWGCVADVAPDPPNALISLLESDDYIGFAISTYTSLVGEAFWIFPYLIIFVPLYIKTESIEYCGIVFILLSSFFLTVFPAEVGTVAAVFLVIGVGLLFYRIAAQAFKGV